MTERQTEVCGLLKAGLTYKEIEDRTGYDQHNARKLALRLGLAYTDEARKKAQLDHVRKTVHDIGAEYVSGYENNKSVITIRLGCGHYANLLWSTVTDAKKWHHGLICNECRRVAKQKKAKPPKLKTMRGSQLEFHACAVCGEIIFGDNKYCSDRCRNKAHNKTKEVRRRARQTAGSHDTDITLARLYRRDRGICWICGEPCDYTDSQETDRAFIAGDTYPSIDHVIPLAKGGTHTWENVKLAHMRCNWMKGDNITPPVDFSP